MLGDNFLTIMLAKEVVMVTCHPETLQTKFEIPDNSTTGQINNLITGLFNFCKFR